MSIVYKHSYVPLSMYGNVVSLLREHVTTTGVHLDIGCGYGAIAEPVRDELGLSYVGFDLAEDGLQSLNERGFDTHVIDLSDLANAEDAIRKAVGLRPIASISFLDTMEHLTNGPDVLAMLRRVAEGSKAPLVISVPNITHKDVAVKLLTGRLDVTEAGILDHTHFSLFSDEHLKRVTASRGWIQVGV
ncbi:methyltransferase domain-containing protein, partial [Vibrio parahaemolyticus]|nr:methyltransferase domain-containing protein [Vibrio parahaemolyticus]